MRIIASITGLLLCATAAIAQPNSVERIDDWVSDITRMIENENLIERHISYTHMTIPGIGQPTNFITGYFNQIEFEEDDEVYFEEVPLMIENIYFHAGYDAVECYYYTSKGEAVCCISTLYDGFEIGRDYIDVFYFSNGESICYISGTDETFETLDEEAAVLARSRLQNARRLMELFMDLSVPAPCIFWERWGLYW